MPSLAGFLPLTDDNQPTDFLLPLLLARKVTDVENLTVEEATSVDAEVKIEYERRLKARLGVLKARRQREVEALLEAQHTYLRNRNPSEGQQREYKVLIEDFNFRINTFEERIKEETVAIPEKMAAFVSKLKADKRLMCVYDPTAYMDMLKKEGVI